MLLESLWRLEWAKLGCGELTAPWPTATTLKSPGLSIGWTAI
jgi:hypothetical protein